MDDLSNLGEYSTKGVVFDGDNVMIQGGNAKKSKIKNTMDCRCTRSRL